MSNTRRYGGLGLGLTICSRLAAALGGSIRVASSPGTGSSFHLELPLDPVQPVALQRQRHLNILLAEDALLSSRTVEILLGKLGHHVITAVNGKEAVEKWPRLQPDLVLMDIQMPVMTGFEALQQIRAVELARGGARTPVIAQTAYARWDFHERSIGSQFDGFIANPLKREELESLIAVCCG